MQAEPRALAVQFQNVKPNDMEQFRDLKHVHCKISGILTEDGPNWTPDRLRPYFEAIIDIFGPGRLVFGSDWPVVDLAGGYERWWNATIDLLAPLDEGARDEILGGTAARVYLGKRGRR